MEDKVSVIIPLYNAEKYIGKAIESVLNQTHKNLEIIVVDDGSTDTSLYQAGRYADRISLYHKENGGPASALNFGIQRATGDWIKWLSADDVLYDFAIIAHYSNLIYQYLILIQKKVSIIFWVASANDRRNLLQLYVVTSG